MNNMRHELISQWYASDEYLQKLRARVQNLQEMHENDFVRAERLLEVYAVDPIRFIEDFCFIKFTEYDAQPKPFFLFEYQKNIIRKIQDFENSNEDIDCLIDKPRGMGLTWLLVTYLTWRWLFTPNFSAFILSRTESEVDDGTAMPDASIFGKIRWQVSMMPDWMKPQGFKAKANHGTSTDSKLKLLNPQMRSSIIGSSTNSSAGRSKRFSFIFVDECFYVEKFQEVYRSLTSVARMKVFVSTTVESATAKKFMETAKQAGTYIPLTWRDHPFKDEKWFEELKERAIRLDDPDLMREAQVDYSVSPKSQYYPQVAKSLVEPVSYDPNRPVYCSLDMGGRQDLTVLNYWQFDGLYFNLLEAYENTNKPTVWYAPFMNPYVEISDVEATLSRQLGRDLSDMYNDFQLKFVEKMRSWKKPIAYFGELDHTVKRRPTNMSDADVLRPFGINISYNQYAIEHKPRHQATSTLLPKMRFNEESAAVMKIYDAIQNSKYAGTDKAVGENLKPIHGTDGTADRRAAVENFAVNVSRLFRNQRKEIVDPEMRSFAANMISRLRN